MDVGASALLAGYALGALLFGGAYLVFSRGTSGGLDAGAAPGPDGVHDVRLAGVLREAAFVGFGWGLWLVLAAILALLAGVALLAYGLGVGFRRLGMRLRR